MARRFKIRSAHYVHLDIVIDAIIESAEEQKINAYDLAVKAKVCFSTLERLCTRQTLFPRYKTIWSLANAVGMTITVANLPKRYRKAG